MGTGFLEVNIQPYRGWEGWAAPRRLHVWCVCLRVRLFPVPSSSTSQKAAAQVAAHPALAVREVVRVPGSVVSHRSLRIPDGTSCRPIRVQVAARTAAGVCGSCVSLFGGWGKTDETSTRSTGTGGGAGCCRGAWGGVWGGGGHEAIAFGGAYGPLPRAHANPLWVRTGGGGGGGGAKGQAWTCHSAPAAPAFPRPSWDWPCSTAPRRAKRVQADTPKPALGAPSPTVGPQDVHLRDHKRGGVSA